MGYDFLIKSGKVKPGHEATLCSELATLGMNMELDCYLVHADLLEIEYNDFVDRLFADMSDPPPPRIKRDWEIKQKEKEMTLYRAVLDKPEIIKGVVFDHPYDPWGLLWNCAHDNIIDQYDEIRDAFHWDMKPGHLLSQTEANPETILEIWDQPPTPFDSVSEFTPGIHVPFRTSDVMQALEALHIMDSHSDDFQVEDHQDLWNKGMKEWVNPLGAWCNTMDGSPVHPDANDFLDDKDDSQ